MYSPPQMNGENGNGGSGGKKGCGGGGNGGDGSLYHSVNWYDSPYCGYPP